MFLQINAGRIVLLWPHHHEMMGVKADAASLQAVSLIVAVKDQYHGAGRGQRLSELGRELGSSVRSSHETVADPRSVDWHERDCLLVGMTLEEAVMSLRLKPGKSRIQPRGPGSACDCH